MKLLPTQLASVDAWTYSVSTSASELPCKCCGNIFARMIFTKRDGEEVCFCLSCLGKDEQFIKEHGLPGPVEILEPITRSNVQ